MYPGSPRNTGAIAADYLAFREGFFRFDGIQPLSVPGLASRLLTDSRRGPVNQSLFLADQELFPAIVGIE